MLRRATRTLSPAATPTNVVGGHGAVSSPTSRYLVFSVGHTEYAIASNDVRRSLPSPSVPGVELSFLGKSYPGLDLRPLFRLSPSPSGGRLSLLVESGDRCAGLLVDTIVGLVQIEAASITPLPKLFSGAERHWFQGLAVVGSRPLIVVRTERLLPAQATSRPARSALPVAGLA